MNLAAFRAMYPEFGSAPDPYVQAFLDRAANRINAVYYDTLFDEAHGALAAHLMVTAPNGQMARLADDKTEDTYKLEFDRIQKLVTFADRIV